LDNGHSAVKMGLSTFEEPQFVLPSAIAFPFKKDRERFKLPKFLVGHQAVNQGLNLDKLALSGRYNGRVWTDAPSSWSDVELLWACGLDGLEVDVTEHPLLASVPLHAPKALPRKLMVRLCLAFSKFFLCLHVV